MTFLLACKLSLLYLKLHGYAFFEGKSAVLHLHEVPDKGRSTDEIEKRKRPAPGGIQTHDLSVSMRALYLYATTTA